jgi:hypothetical protein
MQTPQRTKQTDAHSGAFIKIPAKDSCGSDDTPSKNPRYAMNRKLKMVQNTKNPPNQAPFLSAILLSAARALCQTPSVKNSHEGFEKNIANIGDILDEDKLTPSDAACNDLMSNRDKTYVKRIIKSKSPIVD